MRKTKLAALVVAAAASTPVAAEISLSGFASINAGKVISGTGVPHYGVKPTFLADYANVSAYEEEWDFNPESLFGLQVRADLMDGLSATAQVVARGADEWDPEFEWAYISYDINENWTVQAGKKRLPLFYYSDFFDVGYAYPWMRAPADNYTWHMLNYTGANVLYSTELADWAVQANLYTGKEDNKDVKLLGDFFYGGAEVREIWKDIYGGVFNLSKDWFEARFSAMKFTGEQYINGERREWGPQDTRYGTFVGAAFNFDFGNWFLLTELSQLAMEYKVEGVKFTSKTHMATLGYRWNELTPFVGYSGFDGGFEDAEKHNTTMVGVRWDFHPAAAFKVQYDKVKDESYGAAVAGDSEAITLGVDIVF